MRIRQLWIGLLAAGLLLAPMTATAQDADESSGATAADKQETDAAGGWKSSFAPAHAATYLPRGKDVSVIVAAAGEHAESEPAATTLEKALRDSGEFKLVMNDDALAENTTGDDAKVVEKAKNLPVSHVAVVRVFDSAPGKPPMAVVTFYDKDSGEAISSMSVERGESVAPMERRSASEGVTQEAADAVAETSQESEKSLEEAKQEYLEKFIWFQDMVGVSKGGNIVAEWTTPYRGKYKEELDWDEFYEEVGRPDLADQYTTNNIWKWSLLGVGSAGMLVGPIYGMLGQESCYSDSPGGEEACEARNSTTSTIGWTAFGVGVAAYSVGWFIDLQPVEPSEARRLADKHNKKMAKELGLKRETVDPRASKMKWSLGVTGTPEGGGLKLRLEF